MKRSYFKLITKGSDLGRIDNRYTLTNDENGSLVYVGNDGNTIIRKRYDDIYLMQEPNWNTTARANQSASYLPGIVHFVKVSGISEHEKKQKETFSVKISNVRMQISIQVQ